jgi:UDP-N-acetylmuramoyl-L-alanyl-D-glutamate--2,6-diaminopimelate ligase/murE/murF fusion protein
MQVINISGIPVFASDPEIHSIHYKAQEVKPDGLFVAIRGFIADGHDFIDDALERGASVIVAQKTVDKPSIIIEVANSRKALAAISHAFYGKPSEKLFIIAITGTNGKTTTAFLIESMLVEAGFNVGVIGTINYRYSGKIFTNPITTPESLDLQKILADMLADGITHVVMEVSSHAIDLARIDHCRLDVAVFTNLSQDHLDYHKDMNSYWLCKKRLFTENLIAGPKKDHALAVINGNDPKGRELLLDLSVPSLSTGLEDDNTIRPIHIQQDLTGITGKLSTPAGALDFQSSLVGTYNLENILTATGVGIGIKLALNAIRAGIEKVHSVPGRLEPIPNNTGRFVYVDYAHTPDALENVLTSLKSLLTAKIICVFGCGGDRDTDKRPQMGEIAGRLCDLTIITSDNPRTEPPMGIIDQILEGVKKVTAYEYKVADLSNGFKKKGYVLEPDRKKAIALGVKASRCGDTVLIAGKGHETYQIIGNKTVPFDDRVEAHRALEKSK